MKFYHKCPFTKPQERELIMDLGAGFFASKATHPIGNSLALARIGNSCLKKSKTPCP